MPFASYLLKMSFTGKEKKHFCVSEVDENNSWICVQHKFRTDFQSSHQTDVPYRMAHEIEGGGMFVLPKKNCSIAFN